MSFQVGPYPKNIQNVLSFRSPVGTFLVEQRLTPKQLAQATGVSESSIKRWCDSGEIATIRTPGGHRRIPLSGAIQFLRGSDYELLAPQVLGLPSGTRRNAISLEEATEEFQRALEENHEDRARQILFEQYLQRQPLAMIGDRVIAPAFERIGHRWEEGTLEVFQERRALEITRNLLHEIRLAQLPPALTAPSALGGTLSGDNYALAPILVELVLREAGWRAVFLGSNLPVDTLIAALRDERPALCWLSISHIEDEPRFLEEYKRLCAAAGAQTALIIGGRGVKQELRHAMRYFAHCETLQHLETLATTLRASRSSGPPAAP
jgi:excisionase family DNA binding protein